VRRSSLVFALAFALIFLAACGHKPMQVAVPAAPSIKQSASPNTGAAKTGAGESSETSAEASSETSGEAAEVASINIDPDAKPLLVETGIASWYGAPYHNRRASNGEVYDMHAMTAAHRTLPLGSIVRVTCIENGESAVVRITDRGPFIEGRIIDLSQAAAQKIGLVRKGTAQVRLEVLKTPQPIEVGGRWAVQIGGFQTEDSARDLAGHLSRRYHTAKVLTFPSPAGDWWVRVRVKDDERERAEEVAGAEKTSEGGIFLVRLD
jgi:rare lipoprotein A